MPTGLQFLTALTALRNASGADVRFGAEVWSIVERGTSVVAMTSVGEFEADWLVNCGGLHSDRVCRGSGTEPAVRLIPFKGEYYLLSSSAEHLCRTLVYPVPDPAFPFLGVHLTRMVAGGVEAGPNAVLALGREAYRNGDINVSDLAETLSYAELRRATPASGVWPRAIGGKAWGRYTARFPRLPSCGRCSGWCQSFARAT